MQTTESILAKAGSIGKQRLYNQEICKWRLSCVSVRTFEQNALIYFTDIPMALVKFIHFKIVLKDINSTELN